MHALLPDEIRAALTCTKTRMLVYTHTHKWFHIHARSLAWWNKGCFNLYQNQDAGLHTHTNGFISMHALLPDEIRAALTCTKTSMLVYTHTKMVSCGASEHLPVFWSKITANWLKNLTHKVNAVKVIKKQRKKVYAVEERRSSSFYFTKQVI